MAQNIKPLGDRVLVEAVEEKEIKKGGIIIPDTAKEKPMESVVVALGTGKTDDNGKTHALNVKAGDVVYYGKYSGTDVEVNGEKFVILRESDILGILE